MSHHKIGWLIVSAAGALTVLDGLLFSLVQHIPIWHGVYCIWMTANDTGACDVTPVHQGYLCLALAPVPLIGAAFALFTSALSSVHVRKAKQEMLEAIDASPDA